MPITLPFVYFIALCWNSTVLFQSAGAVPTSQGNHRPIHSNNASSDPCTRIMKDSDEDEKTTANRACAQAFLGLDQNEVNSCRGWRHPECRQLPGSLLQQCSCLISVCNQSGVTTDETKSFGECASDLRPDWYFSEQAAQASGFREVLKKVASNSKGAWARSSHDSFSGGSPGGEGTSSAANTSAKTTPLPKPPAKPRGGASVRAASKHDAGSSKGKKDQAGGKTYQCTVCENVYKTVNALRDHKKSHTDQLTCKLCNKHYSTTSNFRKHIKEVHNMERPRKDFDLNEKPVEANRPYICQFCGARYAWEKSLLGHMKRHDESNPTTCTLCTPNVTFNLPSNYNKHMRTKHGE